MSKTVVIETGSGSSEQLAALKQYAAQFVAGNVTLKRLVLCVDTELSATELSQEVEEKTGFTPLRVYGGFETYEAVSITGGFADDSYTEDEIRDAWQYIHDTGLCTQLEGFYGRRIAQLIDQEFIEQ